MNLDKIKKLYDDNIQEFGISSRSVGWPDEQAHQLRFDKLVYGLESNIDTPVTINDLGCGYGAFFNYLEGKGHHIEHFYGYDISEEMIIKGKELLASKQVEFFIDSKLSTVADYSFTSGIFNVRFEESDAQWEEYIKEVLHNMNQFSKKGFAFNLLSTYVDFKRDHLYYGDSKIFFDYCKKEFSRFVTLLHDYPLYEWTIVVKKEA